MGSFSNYTELKVLEHVVGKTSYTMPSVWAALCTADPGEAGTGASMSEVANAGAYARVSTSAKWGAAAAGLIENNAEIVFPEATASWGVVTHFTLVDSGTYGAGNMLAYGTLTASKTIDPGDTPKFAVGAIDITLD